MASIVYQVGDSRGRPGINTPGLGTYSFEQSDVQMLRNDYESFLFGTFLDGTELNCHLYNPTGKLSWANFTCQLDDLTIYGKQNLLGNAVECNLEGNERVCAGWILGYPGQDIIWTIDTHPVPEPSILLFLILAIGLNYIRKIFQLTK